MTDAGLAGAAPLDDVPGAREELRRHLEGAGLGPSQTSAWLDAPAALLSGLVPAEAITDPTTAARARLATRKLAAGIHGGPTPDNVHVTDVRILEPGTPLVELHSHGRAARRSAPFDLEPYLAVPAFEKVRTDHAAFARLHVDLGAVCLPGDLDLAPELLFSESWPARTADCKTEQDR